MEKDKKNDLTQKEIIENETTHKKRKYSSDKLSRQETIKNTFSDRFYKLMRKKEEEENRRNIPDNDIVEFSHGEISADRISKLKSKKAVPNIVDLKIISDYFRVPIDALVNLENDNAELKTLYNLDYKELFEIIAELKRLGKIDIDIKQETVDDSIMDAMSGYPRYYEKLMEKPQITFTDENINLFLCELQKVCEGMSIANDNVGYNVFDNYKDKIIKDVIQVNSDIPYKPFRYIPKDDNIPFT